jgi:hypothetical protein
LFSISDENDQTKKSLLSQQETNFNHNIEVEVDSYKREFSNPIPNGTSHIKISPHKSKIKLHNNNKTLKLLRQLKAKNKLLPLTTGHTALLCAYTSSNSTDNVNFDIDSVEFIVDTGATATFTYCINDFVTFTPLKSSVSGLETLEIKGIGTVQYTVTTDNGQQVILSIRNAFYVPALQTRLLSPQQLCKQSKLPCNYEGNGSTFILRWETHSKTLQINNKNNLPTMFTTPGLSKGPSMFANIAQNNMSTPKCFRAVRKIPVHKFLPSLEDQDSDNEELINTDTNTSETINVSCSKSKCPDCKQTEITTEASENIDLQSINSMSHDQREYLSIHERLGHPNFGTMQKWSKLGLIPCKFCKITPPLCLACQLGKHHRVSRITNNKIISNTVTKPGDLIHMDQAETTTPG